MSPAMLDARYVCTSDLRAVMQSKANRGFRRLVADLLKPARQTLRTEEAAKPCDKFVHSRSLFFCLRSVVPCGSLNKGTLGNG